MRNTIKYTYICFALMVLFSCSNWENHFTRSHGAIVRGDTTTKEIALVFTGDEFGDGGSGLAPAIVHRLLIYYRKIMEV